jgi:heme-degrading monooxygenase HmoA
LSHIKDIITASEISNTFLFCSKIFFKTKNKGGFMIARLTFLSVLTEDAEDLKKTYNEEIVPVIKSQRGNIGAWLLEPTDDRDDFISLTEWISKTDADNYESSGTYKALVDKVKEKFRGDPVLKTYTVAESKIMTTA